MALCINLITVAVLRGRWAEVSQINTGESPDKDEMQSCES
jgi:hypothetical protein